MPKIEDEYEMGGVQYDSKNKLPVEPPKSPVKSHGCTDLICLVIFIIFIGLLVTLSVFAYSNGDPSSLILPHDSQGRVCGRDPGLEDRRYLFYFDITRCLSVLSAVSGCPTPQICVDSCPTFTAVGESESIKEFCDPFDANLCPDYLIQSKPVFDRCIPEIFSDIGQGVGEIITGYDEVNNVSMPIQILDKDGNLQELTMTTLRNAVEYIQKVFDLKVYKSIFF